MSFQWYWTKLIGKLDKQLDEEQIGALQVLFWFEYKQFDHDANYQQVWV